MKKLVIAALISASVTTPAFTMEIKDYPKTLSELEYCVMAHMNKDIAVPEGCKSLWYRAVEKAS